MLPGSDDMGLQDRGGGPFRSAHCCRDVFVRVKSRLPLELARRPSRHFFEQQGAKALRTELWRGVAAKKTRFDHYGPILP
jgi:hypothetical protein